MKFATKRAFKRIAIGLGLLIGLALVVNGFFAWRAQQRFDSIIAKIKAAGEPTSLADLAPNPIPQGKNAAAYIAQIAPHFAEFEKQRNTFYESPLGEQLEANEQDGKLPNAEELAAMRVILDDFPAFLPTLKQAANCTEYASLMDFSVPPSRFLDKLIAQIDKTSPRSLARFVRWKMATLVADGNSDEAIRLGVQVLRLARLCDHEPTIINFLVSVAIRGMMFEAINDALRKNEVSSEVRAELDSELALQDNREAILMALRSERAFSIPYVQEQTGHMPAMLCWPMMNAFFLKELDVEVDMYNTAKLPLDQVLVRWELVGKNPIEQSKSERFGKSLIAPAYLAAFCSDVRRITQTRCLRVLNALGEYRQRTGKEAENIEQLSLPKEATIDPWSGKPLLLKKTDQGWVVYSVGQNGVDDGGDFTELHDVGYGPLGYPRP